MTPPLLHIMLVTSPEPTPFAHYAILASTCESKPGTLFHIVNDKSQGYMIKITSSFTLDDYKNAKNETLGGIFEYELSGLKDIATSIPVLEQPAEKPNLALSARKWVELFVDRLVGQRVIDESAKNKVRNAPRV